MNEEYITIYSRIPKELYQTKRLSPEDKLIAEKLVYLCKKEGYSWVTNKTLADIYGIKEDTVSQHITNLRNYGFIRCEYSNDTHCRSTRTIYLTDSPWDKYNTNDWTNNQEDTGSTTGHNSKYNYKSNNKLIGHDPDWLYKEPKSQDWNLDDPEEKAEHDELETFIDSFKDGEDNE